MAVQLTIPYETLIALVEQLSPEERQDLPRRLRGGAGRHALSDAAWSVAFRPLLIDTPAGEAFPLRRADWYDDDGR